MKAHALVVLIPLALLAACSRKEPETPAPVTPQVPAAVTPVAAEAATAQTTLEGKSGSAVKGELTFTATEGAVVIDGQLSGLKAGAEHGFHVHETGDCSAPDAKSAGAHFNPAMAMHGAPTSASHHLGDIPNLQADATGNAKVSATINGATLRDGGANDLVGKALIVHAKRDDYTTQPAGDSGDRIACGVIH